MANDVLSNVVELGSTNLPAAMILGVFVIAGVGLWKFLEGRPASKAADNDLNTKATETILGLLDRLQKDLAQANFELARTKAALKLLYSICYAPDSSSQTQAIVKADEFLRRIDQEN